MRIFLTVTLLLSAFTIGCAGPKTLLDARQSLLEDISHTAIGGGDNFIPIIVPALAAANIYEIGSVFLVENFPQRQTSDCTVPSAAVIGPVEMASFPELTKNRNFDAKASLSELSKVLGIVDSELSAKLSLIGEVSWSFQDPMSVTTVDIDILEKTMVDSFPCLSKVINRQVLVLTQIINARESFHSNGVIDSAIELEIMKNPIFDLTSTANSTVKISRKTDVPVVWILAPRQYTIAGIQESLSESEKLKELLGYIAEEGKFDRAEVKIWKPDREELQRKFDSLDI